MIKLSLIKFLAPVLGRAILTRWLGSQIEPGEVAETLTDSLKDILDHFIKDDDIRTRNQGVRLFEEIGESVAESMEIIFRHERDTLSEGELEIVAKATAKTLQDYATIEILLNFEMDAKRLADHLLASNLDAVHAQEQILYRRAIQECSKRIINVAEEIPHFERDAFVEIVKQNQKISVTAKATYKLSRVIPETFRFSQESFWIITKSLHVA